MRHTDWEDLIQRAVNGGLLPADAVMLPETPARPWPVVILTFLGAQLAALPLLGFFGLMMGGDFFRGWAPYLTAPWLIVCACLLMRQRRLALFIEHMLVVALAVGISLLVIKLADDELAAVAGFGGGLLCLVVSVFMPAAWVRSLLGLSAGWLVLFGLADLTHNASHDWWWQAMLLALLWAGGILLQHVLVQGGSAALALTLDAWLAGWLVSALIVAAALSGSTMFVGAFAFEGVTSSTLGSSLGRQLCGVLLFVLASGWLGHRWAVVRSTRAWALLVVCAALSWFMPMLGVVLALAMICLGTGRRRLATAAAVAAAWIIGAFYYQLTWTLNVKAMVLALAGVLLATGAWAMRRSEMAMTPAVGPSRQAGSGAVFAMVGAVVTLVVVNVGIWQKERLIESGRKVYVQLAPVDPRSLMQGDYMALGYKLDALEWPKDLKAQRFVARGQIDAQGVLTPQRPDDGSALADGELRVELVRRNRNWVIASDAWYFREGDGDRWSKARYAEIRLQSDGRALLVGMADEHLQAILP